MPCFFAPKIDENTKFINIENDEFHHIIHVFRKKINDQILLTNGKGILANGVIKDIQKNYLTIQIEKKRYFSHPKPDIAVAFSLLKQKNDFLIVEKLTELGVRQFFPIITDRTIKKTSNNLKDKFIKTAISAIKQCDNAYLPKVFEPQKIKNALTQIQLLGYSIFVAYENEDNHTFFDIYSNSDKICLVFGPEGGFSEDEVSMFKDLNIKTFTLGNHILRAETAAISASAIVINNFFEKDREYY